MAPKYNFKARDVVNFGDITNEALKQLKVWCYEENLVLSDEQLVLFLVFSKNQVCGAQNVIQKYFKCRIKGPDIFSNLDLEGDDMRQATKVFDIGVMPSRTPDNEIVFFARLRDTSYQNFNISQLAKLVFMVVDHALRSGPSSGLVSVIDMKGTGLLHLTKIRIGVVQKFFQYVQEALPCPIKKVHVVNTVSFIDKVLLIIKPFIKKELYDAIVFHPTGANLDDIFENFPKTCLPKDYSGTLPEARLLSQNTYTEMRKLTSFYTDLEQQVRCCETLKT